MKYRRKPEFIDAFKWTGDEHQTEDPVWIVEALKKPPRSRGAAAIERTPYFHMVVHTTGGPVRVSYGDWVVRTESGDLQRYSVYEFSTLFELAT